MIEKPLKLSPDTPVEKALAQMKKGKTSYAVVTNEDGILEGLFSAQILIKSLLPVSVPVSAGIPLDINLRAAPGVAKRLKKVLPLPVSDFMERKMNLVRPESPIWEGVNALMAYGEPLIVVEDEDLKFLGIITSASAVNDLQDMEEA